MQRRRRARPRPVCPWRSAPAWARRSDFTSVLPRLAVQSSCVCRCAEPGRQDVRAQEQEQECKSPAVRTAPSPPWLRSAARARSSAGAAGPRRYVKTLESTLQNSMNKKMGTDTKAAKKVAPAARCAPLQSLPPFHVTGCSTSARHSCTGLLVSSEPAGRRAEQRALPSRPTCMPLCCGAWRPRACCQQPASEVPAAALTGLATLSPARPGEVRRGRRCSGSASQMTGRRR